MLTRLYGLDRGTWQSEASDILERLGLKATSFMSLWRICPEGCSRKSPWPGLSLPRPLLLLLDEPTTGLDPVSKREVQDFVLEERERRGTTIVLTTHDMQEADRLCDRIAVIDHGRFVALDTPGGLKSQVSTNGEDVTLEEVFFLR